LTTAELKQYDGSDPSKPIYLAINGKVYDVSAGEKYYGKEGGYKFFAGVDAARAYITGCFETHLIPDLRGLSEAEIESLSTWSDFYEKHDKYFYVGQVIHDPIPEDAPLPEPCM
ncbi:cytochrome b5-like heme/steroid binding domain-containing protein, partial [Obelidium mucronatum]